MKINQRNFKKGWCFAIIFLFVGASVIPTAMSGNEQKTSTDVLMANTWYVKEGGDDSNGGTGWNDAWRNISYAVGNSLVKDLDTIRVGVGNYTENVVIGKQLTLEGNHSAVCIVDGGGVGNVLGLSTSGIQVTGFTITNSGPLNGAGIFGYYCSDSVISFNIIENNHRGIWFYYGSGNQIINNVIQDNSWGVYLNGVNEYYVEDNWIVNNTHAGVVIEDGQYCDILRNEISENYKWGGLLLYYSFFNEVRGNNFINNGDEDGSDHIPGRESRASLGDNYYEPRKPINLGYIFHIYVVWGHRHWFQFPDLPWPMIIGIDMRRADEPNLIPYPIP